MMLGNPGNTSCPKCHGKGYYHYDENHGKPCELCCPHNQGRWQLSKVHGAQNAGKWACRAGCGRVWDVEVGE